MPSMFSNGRYANVTATLALVIALGGTSYAAISITGKNIRNNTITSADIRNGTIRGADVAASSITSGKIRNGNLLARDFKAGQLPAGAPGPQGAQGPTGVTNVVARYAYSQGPVPANQRVAVTAACAPGEKAVSGGASTSSDAFRVRESKPTGGLANADGGTTTTGWRVEADNVSGVDNPLAVFVVCAGP